MASLLAHTIIGSTGGTAVTTAGINTAGANLIVTGISYYGGSPGTSTPSDSKGNTWTALTLYGNTAPNNDAIQLFYCSNPTVGTGHTFTASATTGLTYPCIMVQAWSGAASSSQLDQQNGGFSNTAGATIQPGSITPTTNGQIIITALDASTSTNTYSIDSSFTISDSMAYNSTNSVAGAMAYFIQPTAGAINPTWTSDSVPARAAAIASFKVSAATNYNDPLWFGMTA